jgi:tripartite-type tricarboxylate transporter receptor subunit TctC
MSSMQPKQCSRTHRLRSLLMTTLAALLLVWGGHVSAQGAPSGEYPTKVVRLVVPRAAGGLVDVVARTYSDALAQRLGQQIIIDNRPGAGGTIAGELVARAPRDGYTLFVSTQDALVLTPILRVKQPYDALRDFTHISLLFTTPLYLFVHPSVPARNVKELVALARANPGKLTYSSLGVGSTQHLAAELFRSGLNLDLVHIPYKSTTQSLVEQMAGQVDINFTAGTSHFPHVAQGKLRVLASTGMKRSSLKPDLPTMHESGVAGFDTEPWYGLSGPAGLPQNIAVRLNKETVEILRTPAIRERFAADGLEPKPSTPAEFEQRIKADVPLWTKTMRQAGFKAE